MLYSLDLSSLPFRTTFQYCGYAIQEAGSMLLFENFTEKPQQIWEVFLGWEESPTNITPYYSDLVLWCELESGYFILSCDSIAKDATIVPNIPIETQQHGEIRKKQARDIIGTICWSKRRIFLSQK